MEKFSLRNYVALNQLKKVVIVITKREKVTVRQSKHNFG